MKKRCLDAGTLRNLADAGCDPETVRCYCEMEQCACNQPGVRQQQIELLRKHRRELLDELHTCQDRIDCLDYLLYQLKEKEHE